MAVTLPGHMPYGHLARHPRGLPAAPIFAWKGHEGLQGRGRSQGLGGEASPLQLLMIFLSKGLQGERGLRGLTGEKGEPVRGGQREAEIDEEPWGDRWGPRVAAVWKMGDGPQLLKLSPLSPHSLSMGFFIPPQDPRRPITMCPNSL